MRAQAAAVVVVWSQLIWLVPVGLAGELEWRVVDDFGRPDSFHAGHGWESLNPGYWKIQDQALRRRIEDRGACFTSWAPYLWFPWHYETHLHQPMPTQVDRSLPFGMIWRRDGKLTGNYAVRAAFTVRALPPESPGQRDWQQDQRGYSLMGVCFGGESLYESWRGGGPRPRQGDDPWLTSGHASWMAAWRDTGEFAIYDHATDEPRLAGDLRKPEESRRIDLKPGDRVLIELAVTGDDANTCTVTATLRTDAGQRSVQITGVDRPKYTDGYFGIAARGLLDFEVNEVSVGQGQNAPVDAPINDLEVCYALGDTLGEVDGQWRCKFVAAFRGDGQRAEVRVADVPDPPGGWKEVPIAGTAPIVYNGFRCNTASIDVTLPVSPAEKTLYYTVWKDGRDVTADPRTGPLGKKDYVGRLPQLRAPYRVCGLGCHSLYGPSELPDDEWFAAHWVHGQPTFDAYKYIEDYDFDVFLWEDDVWYLELLIAPPSPEDAYKTILLTIANPTSRWVMMRHWNIMNPGDHDYGLDDTKGPEQFIVRQRDGLGLNPAYVRRNFQIISHLMTGDEQPSGTDNPRHWRRWKMPDGDFSIVVLDARLWRTSQDTRIWDDEGWGHAENVYDRADPTRALLGEEQFAWLEQIVRTDSSPLICTTGINALHTVWSGWFEDPKTGLKFNQRDRVAADYAGWVKAGADRVIELFGSREGMVSVYGDVHLGCIMRNVDHRLYECCFGAIGRYGARTPKEGFGPKMTDYDGRPVQVYALYHDKYQTPDLQPRPPRPRNWCFLEMGFDPRGPDPAITLKLRDLIDPPTREPRGGGLVEARAATTGRKPTCKLPPLNTLPNADVRFAYLDGRPIRACRSLLSGTVPLAGLVDIAPGTRILMTVTDGHAAEAQILTTLPPREEDASR